MLLEIQPGILDTKERFVERLYYSAKARERVIEIHEKRCSEAPSSADAVLVLGTSLQLFPDKFKKRVYTAVKLVKEGRAPRVIFSGKKDHETDDVDQALDAKTMAVSQFGLGQNMIHTVGGNNTNENIENAKLLIGHLEDRINEVYLVSSSEHLIRAVPLADHCFKGTDVKIHPISIINEETIDSNDPRVIEEVIKTILYNRVLNKNANPVDKQVRERIDAIARFYTTETRSMPRFSETTFEEWKRKIEEMTHDRKETIYHK